MSEIDAIKERHSVRNYEAKKIEADKVEKIRAKIEELNKEGNLHLQFMEDAGKTYNKLFNKVAGLGSAPSVIACVGIYDETLEQRVGYYGEKLVLFIQEQGLIPAGPGHLIRKILEQKLKMTKGLLSALQ